MRTELQAPVVTGQVNENFYLGLNEMGPGKASGLPRGAMGLSAVCDCGIS